MTYLVLGSNSFAGSTFVDKLLTCGEQVVGVSRSRQPSEALRPYAANSNIKNFEFHQLDLNKDFDAIKSIIGQSKPSYVVDFASQSMVAESWQFPEQWYTTNIVAKVRLHNYLKDCDFLKRYVRISTPEVYGHCDGLIVEDQPFNPTTPYAVSQAAIDMSLMAFYKQYDFPVIFTRYANFYGPGQQLYRILPRTVIYGMLQKKLQLHGGGISKRAFIHGKDVASAVLVAIEKGRIGESYHFSTGDCISIADLIKKVCGIMNLKFEQLAEIAAERPGKDFQYFMSADKANRELNWSPSFTLEEGIGHVIDWASNNLSTIEQLPMNYIHKI